MLILVLTAASLVAAAVAIHAVGTTYWVQYLSRRFSSPDGFFKAGKALPAVTSTAVVLMMLHLVEVVLWALAYLVVLPGDHLDTFEKAAYFSVVTFTTLGYGDITLLDHDWRLLSGIEALDGILLVGWTTALLFVVIGLHIALVPASNLLPTATIAIIVSLVARRISVYLSLNGLALVGALKADPSRPGQPAHLGRPARGACGCHGHVTAGRPGEGHDPAHDLWRGGLLHHRPGPDHQPVLQG